MDKQILNQADGATRRQFAKMLAAKFLALNFVSKLPAQANPPAGGGKAKSLILIRFGGGLSHVDSFDIKEANTEANRSGSACADAPHAFCWPRPHSHCGSEHSQPETGHRSHRSDGSSPDQHYCQMLQCV